MCALRARGSRHREGGEPRRLLGGQRAHLQQLLLCVQYDARARLAARVAEALGEDDPRGARLLAITLMGQAIVFRAGRATVLRALAREALDSDDAAAIHRRLEANIRAILKRPEDR